ncbi:MAG: peptidoglycan DD-metalloendopeptidase family protein [Lachnospiraceae bacterium]|nr:peptidoglycan DD-metalloendopeptidase family protein [Lachnospiraceae bacterium]
MKARIRYIYENGETSLYEVILNGNGIEDVLNQLEYLQDIQKYDNSLLDRYIAAKESVEDHEHLLEATLDELNQLKKQEEFDKATLDELYALKAAEIESLTEQLGIADEYLFTYISEISSQDVEIDQIIEAEEKRVAEEERRRQEEEERLRREEEERKKREEEARRIAEQRAAEASRENTTSKVYDKDAINYIVQTEETDPYKMIWPLPGDHRTYSKFGYRKAPTKGASTYHQGWDIGGEFGAPIVSVLAGTAEVVSYNSSAGNFVRVNHGGGLVTVYCHMSKQLVSQGEHVKQGQTIGLVGSTGVSTGPHLHFGVKVNDVYVDPDPYIGPLE